MEQSFHATVQKQGSRVFIALPFDPQGVWGKKQRHYIRGTINGAMIRGSLGSDGDTYFLPLGAAWRRDCGLEAGTTVTVVLWPEGPQQETLAEDIATALAQEPTAAEFFASLATFYRNTYIKGIESAKRPETRTKRIEEMIELLRAGKRQK
jgi:Bacteriocin-protection, YdeI or OmpD-Associated/Domain of unknown function (DUF1905)